MTKTLRWTILVCLFIIPFLSLVVMGPPFFPSWFFPFITGKNFFFRILVEIAFAAWAVLALVDKRYRPQFSYTAILFGAFTVWMAVADAFAVNAHKAFWSNFERMDGFVTLIHLLMLFLVAGAVLTVEKKWDWWWRAFLTGVGMVCAYGLVQMLHLTAIHQGSTRVDASLGNSEYLAGYLMFAIAITVWQFFHNRAQGMTWVRWVLAALGVVELVILYATQTRGTIIGLVAGLIAGAVLVAVESKGKARAYAAGALVALVLATGVFYTVRNTAFVQHDGTLARLSSIFEPAQYATRATLAHMAIEGALAKPITGWGQEGYNYVFNKYYQPSLYGQEPWFDRAHNIFFDWLIAGGIPALLLFMGLLASAFYAFYRTTASRTERIILISILVAYVVEGLTVFDNLFTYVPLVMLLAYAHVSSSRPSPKVDTVPELTSETASTVALPIAVVALILVFWFVNVPSMAAASDLITALTPTADDTKNLAAFTKTIDDNSFASQEVAEQLAIFSQQSVNQQSVGNDTKAALLTLALKQMGAEVAHAPADARLHLEYAGLYRATGDNATAAAELEKVHTLTPLKQSVIVQQGLQAFQAQDGKGAKKYFDQAYQLDPSFSDMAVYAAAGDIVTGDTPLAKKILLQSFATTTVPESILILAYYDTHEYDDLILLLERKARENSGDATPSFQLAEIYAMAGRIGQARALVQATVAAHPETASTGAQITAQLNTLK